MNVSGRAAEPDYSALTDAELVDYVRHGFHEAFRYIMQRCNQRLFRMARGVVNDDSEAEDVVQEAYMHAFTKLDTFRGDSSLLTWMTRIVLNEAYGRLRKARPTTGVEQLDIASNGDSSVIQFPTKFGLEDPAATASRAQMRHVLEQAVSDLPEAFRLVFIMREIEECTTEETAQALGIRPETVKTRLHRARRQLRAALQDTLRISLVEAFPFMGARCARVTDAVMTRLAELSPLTPES